VAVLTFIAHQKLPYRKMLVFTGVMLAVVLMVMVGEQVQEMQLAGWMSVTELPVLDKIIPGWVNMWFAIFPNAEGLTLQMLAMALVGGSYFAARKSGARKDREAHEEQEDMAAAGARILQGN
jgi:high-affinity iron transporter